MVLSFLSYEKNLGILALTDYLYAKIGKDKCFIIGWNYLFDKNKIQNLLSKIEEERHTKNIIVKFVMPRPVFSNQPTICPKEIEQISDLVFHVPTYIQELSKDVPKIFFKDSDTEEIKVIKKYIKEYYS